MKKSRWIQYYESKRGLEKEFASEIKNQEVVSDKLPEDVLKALTDGIYDGKFKKANQKFLADYFNIKLKENGKTKA